MEIAELLRLSHVKRWGIVNTARVQSVAEHSFNVALIVLAIARKAWPGPEAPPNNLMATTLMTVALLHDAEEVRTGDAPTPYKLRLKDQGAKDALADVKAEILRDLLGERMLGVIHEVEDDPEGGWLLKAADFIESIWFIKIEGQGLHGQKVREYLTELFGRHMEACPSPALRTAAEDIYVQCFKEGYN